MTNGNIQEKSFAFAVWIVNLYKYLTTEAGLKELVLSKQFLRSGTSIGAMIREADYGESKADFIHKHSIAQKECNELMKIITEILKKARISIAYS